MEQVAAKQRIKVATKDHIFISRLHLKLHRENLPYAVIILFILAMAVLVVMKVASEQGIESEWEVTGLREGIVSCRNVDAGETKEFKPQQFTFLELTVEGYVLLRLQTDEFWEVQVGDYIILRDDGWFDEGNNFVSISQKYTDLEDK